MKLHCKADLKNKSNWSLECGSCSTCMPTSALHYPFKRDLSNSFEFSNELKKFIKDTTGLKCIDTKIHKEPDLLLYNQDDVLIARIEAKFLEGKAFMKVGKMLSDRLYPKEVLVVDEPKLLSYFECKQNDYTNFNKEIPLFVVWKFDRPCADVGGITLFQEINILKEIYLKKGASRKFTRRTAASDYNSGRRMGVIDKFHYSITECMPIENLPLEINKIIHG
jgi:hypothetical protein